MAAQVICLTAEFKVLDICIHTFHFFQMSLKYLPRTAQCLLAMYVGGWHIHLHKEHYLFLIM